MDDKKHVGPRWRSFRSRYQGTVSGGYCSKDMTPDEWYDELAYPAADDPDYTHRLKEKLGKIGLTLICDHSRMWENAGKPYYKIETNIASEFATVSTDNLTTSHINIPHDAFVILFERGNPFTQTDAHDGCNGMFELASICVTKMITGSANGDRKQYMKIRGWKGQEHIKWNSRGLLINAMFQQAGTLNTDELLRVPLPVNWDENKSPEECWQTFADFMEEKYSHESNAMDWLMHAAYNIAVSVCAFGTDEHELLYPDIPRRLVDRYENALKSGDKADQKRIIDKAKRLGRNGSIIREINLPQDIVITTTIDRDSEGEPVKRGELVNGHYRRAHWANRRCGKDRKDTRLKWIKRTRIRGDLPLKPLTGFAIRDELLERRKKYQQSKRKEKQ